MRQRLPSQAGIAIGPILFIIAILGAIGALLSSGMGEFGQASVADRINADVQSQANLIRSVINQCNLNYITNVSVNPAITALSPAPAPYPFSTTISAGSPIPVSGLVCNSTGTSEPSLWGAVFLPQPTNGFNAWQYLDATGSGGGRCIYTSPVTSSTAVTAGLTKVATKFTSATAYDSSSEVNYNPASASQKFILWINLPTGTPDSHCAP